MIFSYPFCVRSTSINVYIFIWVIFCIKIHLLSQNSVVPFGAFFKFRKNQFFQTKYRFSQYRYTIPVRKFEIRIRSEKLHIVYKNHLDSPKGRFWPFFLVRYLSITNPELVTNPNPIHLTLNGLKRLRTFLQFLWF